MKRVKLYNSNKTFIVDDWNYDRVMLYTWYLTSEGTRIVAYINGKLTSIGRFILNLKSLVDHRDRNIFNNLEANLRPATHSQNCCNASKRKGVTSKYKGVSWRNDRQTWIANIYLNGRKYYLGYFETEEAAARAYDEAAKRLHGEFAVLNFPDQV